MTSRTYSKNILLAFIAFLPTFLLSQTDSIPPILQLETIQVSALKIQKPWLRSATSIYQLTPNFKDQVSQNSLKEFISDIPGVFSLNANNQVQDLRISIRGFGSRAAFGVRGIKLIVDGIPETTADGQGQLDNLNLPIIENIEVLPSGASALYGNASGGVIQISTIDERVFRDTTRFADYHVGLQSFKGQQYQLTSGRKFGKTSFIFHVDNQRGNGYRDYARFKSLKFNLRTVHEFSKRSKLELLLNYMDSPTAQDPGGVDLMTFNETPRAARDRNVEFSAGEKINQFKGSLRYKATLSKNLDFNTYAFYSNRDFSGRLPFENSGTILLKRNFFGAGSSLGIKKMLNKFQWKGQLGYELLGQRDNRRRFDQTTFIGELRLSQKEQFNNAGFFWANDLMWERWVINTAIRYDLNNIKAIDNFLGNGDDSGTLDLNNFSYSLGMSYAVLPSIFMFGNISTSFETPTLNELSNNPDGSGFNPTLNAQSATHYEAGLKGMSKNKNRYQLSFFLINSAEELLPYELEASPGRLFYRNVGSTERKGIELFLAHKFNHRLNASTNWSWQDFTFTDYELDGINLAGNKLPGLPNFQGNLRLSIKIAQRFHLNVQQELWGKIYTNDINDEFQDTKTVTNLSLKYQIEKGRSALIPYFGVNNIFQTKYADNIRINAFGGRFYEAAPNTLFYGGVRLKFLK